METCFFARARFHLIPLLETWGAGDIKAQTERVLENIKVILEDQKLSFANVVKTTVFLTNLADFAGMNELYAKYFTGEFPALLDYPGSGPSSGRDRGNRSDPLIFDPEAKDGLAASREPPATFPIGPQSKGHTEDCGRATSTFVLIPNLADNRSSSAVNACQSIAYHGTLT